MKRGLILLIFLFIVILSLLDGCTSNNISVSGPSQAEIKKDNECLILGRRLEDPYTIENIKAALRSLVQKKNSGLAKVQYLKSIDTVTIKPNYLYVRFLPYGKREEGILFNYDTNLVMFPYPMDYEIVQAGRDTSFDDSIRVHYAAVPINYDFCDSVNYEILKELFLIEPVIDSLDSVISLAKKKKINTADGFINILASNDISLRELEEESFLLTDNLEARMGNNSNEIGSEGLSKRAAKWGGP